ncbi:MAG: hypothetical protein IPO56_16640, partial [Flavobacteriales bacterium]|nr:hypothetical protein [Flavobacteriales bacterium]
FLPRCGRAAWLPDLFFKGLLRALEEGGAFSGQQGANSPCFKRSRSMSIGEWFVTEASSTDEGSSDIVLTGRSASADDGDTEPYRWCILIENKIHAGLGNPFKLYEGAIKAERKVCCVLGVKFTDEERKSVPASWHFITHEQLVQSIKGSLGEHFIDADDRHLLLLKEYFMNINRLYMTPDGTIQRERLNVMHKHAKEAPGTI